MGGGRNKLSAAKVAKCSRPGYLLDGGNLYLQVASHTPKQAEEKRPPNCGQSFAKAETLRVTSSRMPRAGVM